jgi:hypothetical protein
MKKIWIRGLWMIAVLGTGVMSATFLIMPLTADLTNSNRNSMLFVTGIIFWTSLLLGYGAWIAAGVLNKKNKKEKAKFKIRIFENEITTFFDVMFCIASLWLLIEVVIRKKEDYSIYICICSMLLSLNMQGLFSGDLYKFYIKKYEKGCIEK